MPKSVTRTLRVDEELDRAVAKRAADEGVTVNFLVNRQLKKFTDWDAPGQKIGLVTVPSVFLGLLADKGTEDELMELGRRVAKEFLKPAAEYVFGRFSLEASIQLLRRTSQYSGTMNFDFVQGSDSRKSVLLVKHDQGPKWSSYYMGLMEETFIVLLGLKGKFTHTESLCIMQLDSPST